MARQRLGIRELRWKMWKFLGRTSLFIATILKELAKFPFKNMTCTRVAIAFPVRRIFCPRHYCSHCQRSGNQERAEAAERKSSLLRLTTHFQAAIATLQCNDENNGPRTRAPLKVLHKRITRLESVTNEFHPFMLLDVK